MQHAKLLPNLAMHLRRPLCYFFENKNPISFPKGPSRYGSQEKRSTPHAPAPNYQISNNACTRPLESLGLSSLDFFALNVKRSASAIQVRIWLTRHLPLAEAHQSDRAWKA